ncbi:MAG: right-handed parallel beta-helix repeat-containing protein [Phycisphaerales bacterium]|nr:right-handed parallel beta-helix repeat-containing protein [Phycisphaerales bacterium]MCB9854804.1 right-handed parallel beta-helix repeat-containing protein [Phycisphaerales bacterium]MCB9863724.1 right-handed parallel beta-helix repeat-containing protein [Phycisphaerales bacterium]
METVGSLRGFLVYSTILFLWGSVPKGVAGPTDPTAGPPPAGPRGGGILIVDCTGAGDYTTIQAAIDAAVDGDEVVVMPNTCNAQGRWTSPIDFVGKAITVRSMSPDDESVVNATIIDGLNSIGPLVRMASNETSDSILDGLTIVNGLGGTQWTPAGFVRFGGGVDVHHASPTIRRCAFAGNNSGGYGGAIRVEGGELVSIESCRFSQNYAANGEGAAIGYTACANPRITGCSFANLGGKAIWMDERPDYPCELPSSSGVIESCNFSNCTGTILRMNRVTLSHCVFGGNNATCLEGYNPTILDCEFTGNTLSPFGLRLTHGFTMERTRFENNNIAFDAIYCESVLSNNAQYLMRDCVITRNMHGSIATLRGSGLIENCEVSDNSDLFGGIYAQYGDTLTIDHSQFVNNHTLAAGGALDLSTRTSILNSRFFGNSSNGQGGAIKMNSGSIQNCLIVGNRAGSSYGGVFATQASVDGCTIVGNLANRWGGGNAFRISNSIVYANRQFSSPLLLSQFYLLSPKYVDVDGAVQYSPGVIIPGLIQLDPQFVDPGSWDDMGTPDDASDDVFTPGDYHLLPTSPCIDSGDPAYVSDPGSTDLDGEPRVQSCRIDMGAYEFIQDIPIAGDVNGDGFVTFDDVAPFAAKTLANWGPGVCAADVNGDGVVNSLDIAVFVSILLE